MDQVMLRKRSSDGDVGLNKPIIISVTVLGQVSVLECVDFSSNLRYSKVPGVMKAGKGVRVNADKSQVNMVGGRRTIVLNLA
jgi:hypothetical protein